MQRAPTPLQRLRGRKARAKVCGPHTVRGALGPRLHAGECPFWFFSPRFLFPLQPEAETRGRPGGVAARGRDWGPRGAAAAGGAGDADPRVRRSAGARGAAGAGRRLTRGRRGGRVASGKVSSLTRNRDGVGLFHWWG